MSRAPRLYFSPHLHCRHLVLLPRMADESQASAPPQFADEEESKRKMASELERLMNVDALRFGGLSPAEAPSASKRVGDGAQPESRIQTLSLVLESIFLFYGAMRSGKPLACGDERLAQ
jgi:hypothetical protein